MTGRIEIEFKREIRYVRDKNTGDVSGVEFLLCNTVDGSSVLGLEPVKSVRDKGAISDVFRRLELDFVTRYVTTSHLRNNYLLDYETKDSV